MIGRQQQGVALITVLLVVAIVTVVCSSIISRQQLAIRLVSNQLQARQAWHYALGGEALAQSILARDFKAPVNNPQESVDHMLEAWAHPLPVFPIEQGEIAVRIEDLSGRFNLNSLVQDDKVNSLSLARFRRLLLTLSVNQVYAERLIDWLDADQETTGEFGAEDNAYLRLEPAYRSANGPITDISELRLLLEMSEDEYRRLQPYVSALPADVKLNVNTASALVLSCLTDELTPSMAQDLIAARGAEGYRQVSSFLAQPILAGKGMQGDGLAVDSQYFEVLSEVHFGGRSLFLLSMLQRDGKGLLHVLRRDLGQPSLKYSAASPAHGEHGT